MRMEIYNDTQQEIEGYGLSIVAKDMMRLWGAFLVFKEEEAQGFC